MRAVVLSELGDPGRLVADEVEEPLPGPDDVLIRVHAAGVNFADVLIRRCAYAQPPSLPTVLGNEVAGEVIVGDAGGTFAPGDRVAALPIGGGGYAELAAVRRGLVFRLPAEVSYVAGAALLMTYCTAQLALRSLLRIRAGEALLVHAAGGGVGSAAVQLGRHLGARVLATAGSEDRVRLARELGADVVIDRSEEDFVESVRRLTGGEGVDAVVDPLGGEILERSLTVIRPFGGLVAVGEAAGAWPSVPIARLVGRNVGVHGVYLARVAKHAPLELRVAGESVVALAAAGSVEPVVGAVFALEAATDAHALIEARGHVGKVVLTTAAAAAVR